MDITGIIMKQVTLTKPEPTIEPIYVGDVNTDLFYGVEFCTNRMRGMITRKNFGENDFTIASTRSYTKGNGWTVYNSHSLSKIIDKLITENHKVFEFEKMSDMVLWCEQGAK